MDTQNQQLASYIQQALAAGQSPDVIRAQLLSAGWQAVMVDPAIKAIAGHPSTPPIATNTSPVRKRPSKKLLIIAGASAIVVILLIVGLIVALAPKATDKLAEPSIKQTQSNNSRQVDASNIATAVNNYIGNSSGNLPTQLKQGANASVLQICGGSCAVSSTTSVNLTAFTAKNVVLEDFKTSIGAPKVGQLLIVKGASCHGNVLTSGSDRSVALVYMKTVSSTTQQQCLGQ